MKFRGCQNSDLLVRETKTTIMSESSMLEKNLAYISGKKFKAALEAEVKYMFVKAKETEVNLEGHDVDFKPEPPDK